jgi:hypothetical protein
MTMSDLRCDHCGRSLVGPAGGTVGVGDHLGVRFAYHPGDRALLDSTGLLCVTCWDETETWLGPADRAPRCARCAAGLDRSLFVERVGEPVPWRLCDEHTVAFLNRLRTVEPKLDPQTFRWPDPTPEHGSPDTPVEGGTR